MTHVIIKETQDIDALVDMRMEVLQSVFGLERTTALWEPLSEANRQYYETHLANGTHIACMAYLENRHDIPPTLILAGCGSICLHDELPSPENPSGRCAYLMNVYVRPECRQRGVATAMVKWLTRKARALGCGKVYLESTDQALNMYDECHFGMMPNMMRYDH